MKLTFHNMCKDTVELIISKDIIKILPKQQRDIEINDIIKQGIYIKLLKESKYYRGKVFLNLESCYMFDKIVDGNIFIESKCICEHIFMEYISVMVNGVEYKPVSYKIAGENRIKKVFLRKKLVKYLITQPIECFWGLIILCIIGSVVISRIFGLYNAIVFLIITYPLIIMMNIFCEIVIRKLFKKNNSVDEKKVVCGEIDVEFIERYILENIN